MAGFKEARSVSQLVERFNEHGLAALSIAAGRDRKATYTGTQQAYILAQVQRQPEGHPALQPHEYERGDTAKLLTLFRPATGQLRARGVLSAPMRCCIPGSKSN